ncbi:MAG: penicillin-binding protein 1A [Candidatus Porifericomitaceae bacterium WSBS_2022_MAG_OTU9]
MTNLLRIIFEACLIFFIIGIIATVGTIAYLLPSLPGKQEISDVQLQVPLRIYSRSGDLIGTFGDKKRIPISIEQVSKKIQNAVLAAEDSRFYQHPGVDWRGILRATISLVRQGQITQGGSTITMQVARNYFLTPERTFQRKAREMLLALRIEKQFSKQQILGLYLNKIFFGHRSYGIAAAAETYYGLSMDELSLAQVAMLAGLPQRPSYNNPVSNPEASLKRRKYVLNRMLALGYIDQADYEDASAEPATATLHNSTVNVYAPHAAAMVRSKMIEKYGKAKALSGNFQVYTSIDPRMQYAANSAMQDSLLAYSTRHGYRGPVYRAPEAVKATQEEQLLLLKKYHTYDSLLPALVQAVSAGSANILVRGIGQTALDWEGMSWVRPYLSVNSRGQAPTIASEVLKAGDIVYVREDADGQWKLVNLPKVEGGFVAIDPGSGAMLAINGGFDFKRSQFNRVTQASRQPGSGFKPFLYSAALEAGYTAASTINDATVVYEDVGTGGGDWKPKNYSGKTYGPTRLRQALTKSQNLVSIRLLDDLGIPFTKAYVRRFGFDPESFPEGMAMALGSQAVTMIDMAKAYSTFANGGYLVNPYIIERIEQGGEIVFEQPKKRACPQHNKDCPPAPPEYQKTGYPFLATIDNVGKWAPRILSEGNVWLINSILRDVITRGTAVRARQLNRADLAGKTGTTNDQRDAWFFGFNPYITAISWIGFDDYSPLGKGETGSRAALPMWIDFMRQILPELPEPVVPAPPPGMVSVLIDPESGEVPSTQGRQTIREIFRARYAPVKNTAAEAGSDNSDESGNYRQIF